MADVRIGQVDADVTVADAAAFLDPEVLDRIVAAVLHQLEQRGRAQAAARRDKALQGGPGRG